MLRDKSFSRFARSFAYAQDDIIHLKYLTCRHVRDSLLSVEAKNKEKDPKKNKEKQAKECSNIRRMLVALDKFLNKRIMGIGILYFGCLIVCGAGLVVHGVISNASSGGGDGGIDGTDAWIFSVAGVFTLLFFLAIARVISIRFKKSTAEKSKIANTK